ncbi:MAG TPA: hypothetical protein VGO22_16895 [Pseudorhizobium sp.]|jgi:tRNA nucleotidyltransferase/poly(A) polymerase|nr:hypothetical protein [Pseudorhizobium sp.]
MPKYFLHLRERDALIRDLEGAELKDLDAARNEAVHAIRDIVAEHIATGEKLMLQTVEICDEEGKHIATVKVAAALQDTMPVSDDMFEVNLSNYVDSDAARCSDIVRH